MEEDIEAEALQNTANSAGNNDDDGQLGSSSGDLEPHEAEVNIEEPEV